jgi:hypothetical protein
MLVEAFGENTTTFLWYKRFKNGRKSVDDDESNIK